MRHDEVRLQAEGLRDELPGVQRFAAARGLDPTAIDAQAPGLADYVQRGGYEALKKLEGFRLDGIAQKVECPFLLMHGAEDAQVSTVEAQKLFDAIGAKDKTFRIFTAEEGGAEHCQRDYLVLGCEVVADWLDEKLK